MCTGFVKKGKDIIAGFNLDIDPNVWNFDIYKTNDYFTVGITIGKRLYFTHGVNKEGHFSNLPYMNDSDHGKRKVINNKERIDLLTDRYLRNIYTYDDVLNILNTKTIVNIPRNSLHTLLCDRDGNILIIEPEYGYQVIKENYMVITNFPLLVDTDKFEPWHGKDRFDKAYQILKQSGETFSVKDGINLLNEVKQQGKWATRVSFVYSYNENCVYYFINGDNKKIYKHKFGDDKYN